MQNESAMMKSHNQQGIEMEYSMQLDEDLGEIQSDEEIRRQLGWYLTNAEIDEVEDE